MKRRFGPARGDRVNFPHHNDRAIVLPDLRRRDPNAEPAHALEHVPWPGESASEVRARELAGRGPDGRVGWPVVEREMCVRCGAHVRKKVGGLYTHLIPGTTTTCSWND